MSDAKDSSYWSEIVSPTRNLWKGQFKGLWEYRDLVFLLTKRDIVAFYKQTILGPLWFFIQPALTTMMYIIVFARIAEIPIGSAPAPIFYLSGVVIWNYFSDCLNKTSLVFKENASIFGKVYFPRLVMPVSIVISNLIKFFVQLLLLFVVYLWYACNGYFEVSGWAFIILPGVVLLMALMGLGLGMIFSALTTKYRDLTFLLGFGVQLLMYVTPVIYPVGKVSPSMAFYINLNPLSALVELFRFSFIGEGYFSIFTISYSILSAVIFFVIGTLLFNRAERNFMDTV